MIGGEPRARAAQTWPWWLGFLLVSAIALRLSQLAYQDLLPPMFEEADKIIHFTVAGSLAFFLDGALGRRSLRLGPMSVSLAAALLLVTFGVEEFLQRFSVHRSASFADYFADVVGVVVLTWLSRHLGQRSEPRLADARDDRPE